MMALIQGDIDGREILHEDEIRAAEVVVTVLRSYILELERHSKLFLK